MIRRLNDVMVRQAKPNENGKPKKYTDRGQMYLVASKTGKYWRYNYKFAGKSKTLAMDVYPNVSLKEARKVHEEAREQLERGVDPKECTASFIIRRYAFFSGKYCTQSWSLPPMVKK